MAAATTTSTTTTNTSSPPKGGRRPQTAVRLLGTLAVRVGFVVFSLLSWLYSHLVRLPGIYALSLAVTTQFLRLIRWHMDGYWTRYSHNGWLPDRTKVAQDNVWVMQGVAPIDTVRYGAHEREFFHVVRLATAATGHFDTADDGPSMPPRSDDTPEAPDARVVLYVHGGGFVCASSAVLLHSITCFARQGFTVYSAEYPLAPQDPFPAALISVLRALDYLRRVKHVRHVQLLGDSAGANLVTMASALVFNPPLLAELAAEVRQPELAALAFPAIDRQVALYGLLDGHSWREKKVPGMGPLENAVAVMGLHSCLALYNRNPGTFGDRITLLDLLPHIQRLPPTYIIGAEKDALVFSSRAAYDQLKHAGFDVQYKVYNARHGFFGFPPAWTFGNWKISARPCAALICKYFRAAYAHQ